MKVSYNLEPEHLKEEQELWDLYREVMRSKGVGIGGLYLAAVEQLKQKLPSPGARSDFRELISVGSSPEVLGVLVALFRYSPRLKEFWENTIGRADKRQRAKRELESAAATLERIFALALNADEETKKLARSRLLMPSQLISQLRLYVELIRSIGATGIKLCGMKSGQLGKSGLTCRLIAP